MAGYNATGSMFPLGGDAQVTIDEGVVSLNVVPGRADTELVHLDAIDVVLTQAFMLVDLSDTTNWPHSNTGHVDLLYLIISTDPTTTFTGDIDIGFLTNVDATDGDFNELFEIHMEKKPEPKVIHIDYGFYGVQVQAAHVFGPVDANNTLFRTDVNLKGPDGATSYPSGAGDLVMLITRGAGDISVSVTVGYRAVA